MSERGRFDATLFCPDASENLRGAIAPHYRSQRRVGCQPRRVYADRCPPAASFQSAPEALTGTPPQQPGSRDGRQIRRAFIQRDPQSLARHAIPRFESIASKWPTISSENRSRLTNSVGTLPQHSDFSSRKSDSATGKTDASAHRHRCGRCLQLLLTHLFPSSSLRHDWKMFKLRPRSHRQRPFTTRL